MRPVTLQRVEVLFVHMGAQKREDVHSKEPWWVKVGSDEGEDLSRGGPGFVVSPILVSLY